MRARARIGWLRLTVLTLTVALGSCFLGATPSRAETTLAQILAKHEIVVGSLVDFPPFGFLNKDQKPEGLDIGLARLMAKYLGVKLKIVQVSDANRVPYLQSKKVDVLIASLGITPERAKQVMFSDPYAEVDVAIAAPEKLPLTSMSQLTKYSVAVARGSSQAGYIEAMAPKGAKIMYFDGEIPPAQAMVSGQANAWADNTIMIGEIAKKYPDLHIVPKIVMKRQANAIAVRIGDFELEHWINTFLFQIKLSGELDALYRKWFNTPMPNLPNL